MNQKDLINEVLDYRKKHEVFKKSIDQRSEKLQSITYDWPPFASWTPHFGHWLVSVMKDLIGRYRTMKWYKVVRDRWRDCHGLPVEKAVEKDLGIDWKKDIEQKLWVKKFTEACRSYVSNVNDEWKWFVDHVWRWADMDNAYFTMNLDFMESVIWVFKNMYNQNLVYKWFKNQWCCPSCATTLANNEVNDWYRDRQDPAITVKFKVNWSKLWNQNDFDKHQFTNDGFVDVVAAVIKKDWKYLMVHHQKENLWFFPGWKVDRWEALEDALIREIKEEMWVSSKILDKIWTIKIIHWWKPWRVHYFDTDVTWIPKIQENEKHTDIKWVEKIDYDGNDLWFALKIDDNIISEKSELQRDFVDYRLFHSWIFSNIETENADLNILAWTTTPWTLPSNMFLAAWADIDYILVFDVSSKEYYVIAENLLKQYYKNPDEYIQVYKFKWNELWDISYQALFDYINKSDIDKKYKDQFFKVILWEFVSTEDWTWIVHIAPGFGQEDFDVVANFLPREDSKNWLFMPVDDFGEFTQQVDDYKWRSVFDVNKEVITRLKEEKKLIWQRSYSHSYPHCRRCETPLIQKAVTSRFIKEQELTKITVPNSEKIWFVPETVKNRFRDTLNSAPDWNLSRNRYRWSPLPVWENKENKEDRVVVWTLEEIYQNTINWSKNLTKNILIRHWRTDFNDKHLHDCLWESDLNLLWQDQSNYLSNRLKEIVVWEFVIIISPLKRCWQTILPYLKENLKPSELDLIEWKYLDVRNKFESIYPNFLEYIENKDNQKLFPIWENVYVDFRITEFYLPDEQWNNFDCHRSVDIQNDEKRSPNWESVNNVLFRVKDYVFDVNEKFVTKTIVSISHGDPIVLIKKVFSDFDYNSKKEFNYPKNANLEAYKQTWIDVRYRDSDNKKEVDLHKPYIDSYWFNIDGKEYYRIPEVMDCRFESWSMPFGQVWYTWSTSKKPFVYPADYIIEWLDQTRWWFRTMHVVWNAIMWKNSFNNVIINWLILAEDWRKMSKQLKNYPDPKYIFERYWTDAYRLYLLSSPAVRSEPMRFSEKWVDQVYKDFTTSVINSYNFFETYANVDNFKSNWNKIYFMLWKKDDNLEKTLDDVKFLENIIRINPDLIYISNDNHTSIISQKVVNVLEEYVWKKCEIRIDSWLSNDSKSVEIFENILETEKWKNILIISDINPLIEIRKEFYDSSKEIAMDNLWIIKLPNCKINNELDKWLLSAINQLGLDVQNSMDNYKLDDAARYVLGFVDKLNNRYIRRSRRRFWASGLDQDKLSAYNVLFDVLEDYIKIFSPFAPFLAENIYLKLQKFKSLDVIEWDSVHLKTLSIFSDMYIDNKLLEEISFIRRIISLWLFVRSKNSIKIKQPLNKLEIKN